MTSFSDGDLVPDEPAVFYDVSRVVERDNLLRFYQDAIVDHALVRLELTPEQAYQYYHGILLYHELDAPTLEQLVAMNQAHLEDAQNDAPSIGKFLAFMREWPETRAHGYAVRPERDDYRLSVEGLTVSAEVLAGLPDDRRAAVLDAFARFCRRASELSLDPEHGLRSWWD